MENNTKKNVASVATAAVVGAAAGAGITAANMTNNRSESNTNNTAVTTPVSSEYYTKVTTAINNLTGQKTATTTTNTATTQAPAASTASTILGDASIYQVMDVPQSDNAAKTQTTDSFTDVDNECYKLLMEAHEGFHSFNIDYETFGLADAIEINYDVKFSPEQDTRYAYLMRETYLAYCDAIGSYTRGDVSCFRKQCAEILNGKFLNLDDLIDILSININTDEKVINNSRNYSISKDELVIDGVHVKALFSNSSYEYRDIMSILGQFDCATASELNSLKILQVPLMIIRETISPTSFCLICDNTIYEYRNEQLGETFNNINKYFAEGTGLASLGYEDNGNSSMIYGYDAYGNKQPVSREYGDYMDLSMYVQNLYPRYEKSKDGRVGYFDGDMLRDYIIRMDAKMNKKSATK